ncbi:FtsX-like permease family protein [Microbispora sp. NBC_01389]|uniref:FtsX-like permease family protein n=1 Tax=Microbispora sp. NBC_01389 TaxID=2903584 RepID=UPI003244F974
MGVRAPLAVRRALSEPWLLLAAFGSILLATTTLVALATYTSSVAEVGVRRAMENAPASSVATTITAPVRQGTFAGVERAVHARLAALAGSGGGPVRYDVRLSARSDSYALPGQERLTHPELTRFGVDEGLEGHARLMQGVWPRPATGGVVEVAASQAAAQAMNLGVGDEFRVVGRLDDTAVRARLTGVFRLDDSSLGRWDSDDLLRRGVRHGDYTTYGPLMVPGETFLARFTARTSVAVTWTAVPDLGMLTPQRLRPFSASVARLGEDLKRDCPACETVTNLPGMLSRLDRAALVARSTMLVPVLQLLLLAAYALVLTARLLADHRRMEVALLRSRGAGGVRLALSAGAEALLVAAPCAALAPFLAPPLLGLVDAIPWIRASGVRVVARPGAATFGVAAAVALACAVLLALPALRGARRTYVEEQAERGRGARQGLLQRAGGDVALLVVAALAIWQLRRYGAPVTATSGGGLGIDPLIVTGPALALLCGGMLGLRLVPRVSRIAGRFTSRRAGLAPALGAWQVSRRPERYSGPALLLTMAVAIGVVSMTTAATWRGSQVDQARHQAGADLRVSAAPVSGELGRLGRGPVYAGLPGVTAITPVYRGTMAFSGGSGTLLAADAAKLGPMLMLRPDLGSRPVGTLAARLAAGRPAVSAVPLPGTPEKLTLSVRAGLGAPPASPRRPGSSGSGSPGSSGPDLRMVIADALGVRQQVPVGPLVADGEAHPVTVDLAALAGRSGRLSYPLDVRGFVVRVPAPVPEGGVSLTVDAITTDTGASVALPEGLRWAPRWGDGVRGDDRLPGVTTGAGILTLTVPAPAGRSAGEDTDPEYVSLTAEGGSTGAPVDGGVGGPLPVVVTADIAARERLAEGRTGLLTLDGQRLRVAVAGVVEAMPGTPAGVPVVLADLPTLLAADLAGAREPRVPGEWWMSTAGGDTAGAAAALARHPEWEQTVVDLGALTLRLRDDPLASGLQGALVLGFAAALVFAVLGFLVNAAVAARERASEFAVLRALGVSGRQVFALLAVEQAFLIALSLAAGTVLALGVAALVVPNLVLTGQAASVTPEVVLQVPWAATVALPVVVAVLLFAIVAGLAHSLRRRGLGGALRAGEDR